MKRKKRETWRPKAEIMNACEGKREHKNGQSLVPVRGTRQFKIYTPTTETLQNKLADELIQWVLASENHVIKTFFHTKQMSLDDFKKRTANNEYCKEALVMCREIIADRLQNAWQKQQLDVHYAMRYTRHYDDDLRATEKEMIAAKTPQATASGNKEYIIMNQIPNSNLVKERQ